MAQLDLNNIREQMRSILSNANTTTASVDLSQNLTNRIVCITKKNPEKIDILGNEMPAVCIYSKSKEIAQKDVVINLSTGKREGRYKVQIAGLCFEPFGTDTDEDDSETELEYLMENIEEILRANATLNGSVKWNLPVDVNYHSASFDEEAHFRVGFLNIDIMTLY